MRLGILADTHDELGRTRLAIAMLREAGADALVHCGDLFSPPIVEALSVLPSWFVFGNHDADAVPHLESAATAFGVQCLQGGGVFTLGQKRIGVAHGHLTDDVQRVLGENPDVLLSGHSHAASDGIVDFVRRINPGALHRADEFTVALLDLETDLLRFLTVPRYPWRR